MDIKINDQKKDSVVWPEKSYTQHEVDALLEKKEEGLSSQAEKIEEETQTADKQQRLEDTTVANLVKKSNRIAKHFLPWISF